MRPEPGAPARWQALLLVATFALAGAAGILVAGTSWMAALGGQGEDDGRPLVVTSITILADLARQVAGERVRVYSLLAPGQDPHTYEPVPRDALAVARARIVLINGYQLDFWAERLAAGVAGGPTVVRVAERVPVRPLPWPDDPGRGDPHLWMDPLLVTGYVEVIRDALVALDPQGAAEYRQRAASYIDELRQLDRWIARQLAVIPPERRKLVTTHDAYRYFGRRYGIEVLDTVWGVSTEEEPSAYRLTQLFGRLRAYRVPPFVETTINPQLMRELATQAGLSLGGTLYGDALGPAGSGADTYVGMMRHNVQTIVSALAGASGVFSLPLSTGL